MSNFTRFTALFLIAGSLSACVHTDTGWRSVSAPRLTRQRSPISIEMGDGRTRSSRVSYHESVSRSGLSQREAVELDCFNSISGHYAENDVLERRFPGARRKQLDDVRSGKRIYHRYQISDTSRDPFVFWIDATDYHMLF